MNFFIFLISRFVRSGKYARALALAPILGKSASGGIWANLRRIAGYIGSGYAARKDIALLALFLIYLVSPINFATFPFGGFLLDAALLAFVFGRLSKKASNYYAQR